MFKRCLTILADGARPDVLFDLMKKGDLPTLSRYFAEGGTASTILTAFPSTTGPAYLPFVTGCYPGTCNVPGIRWFDKDHYHRKGWGYGSFRSYVGFETFLMNRDIRPEIRTAFEIFQKPSSVLNMVNRGLKGKLNTTRFLRIWYHYYAHLTDHCGFTDRMAGEKLLALLDHDPDYAFVVFPGIDEFSHRSSPFHPTVLESYRSLDRHLAPAIEKLKRRGRLDETLLVLVADHGLSETHTHFDVGPYLEEKGKKTFYYSQIVKRDFTAASMISGNAMAHLYFKGGRGWQGRMTFEELSQSGLLLDELRFRPEVALVSVTGEDGSIHLLSDKGHGWFRTDGNGVDYQWNHGCPLGLFKEGNSKKMTWDETLTATFDSQFPDAFMQLSQIFRSPRTGDVVLSARPGFDLRRRYEHPEHKSSHGSLSPEHMKIPLLMNARLSTNGRPIRSVDIFPTILKLTGKVIPEGIDGKYLI
ncbi:MAG: alkaline phosphatase family protein [Deltaproteobacteria bacterium]|nr:alkaline phosphatase family protein [Deltaproteobacteria bacterium]